MRCNIAGMQMIVSISSQFCQPRLTACIPACPPSLPHAAEMAGRSGAYLQDCQLSTPARRAKDDVLAAALWTKSEELVAAALQKAALDP